MQRRRVLAIGGATLSGPTLSGCFTRDSDWDSPTPSPTDPTPTEEPLGHNSLSDEPDPDHLIHAENNQKTAQTIRLTVRRESREKVHNTTHEIPPGRYFYLYNLKKADPNGIETFTITAEYGNQTESVTVKTNACYSETIVTITESGGLQFIYAVC